jgi:hypothetical protein
MPTRLAALAMQRSRILACFPCTIDRRRQMSSGLSIGVRDLLTATTGAVKEPWHGADPAVVVLIFHDDLLPLMFTFVTTSSTMAAVALVHRA